MFVAFFSFSMAVRVYNHVGYMINVPLARNHKMISPKHVAAHLNRAGRFYSVGMRAYYFAVPLVFWLFGPHFMLLSTLALIMTLYRLDRAPKILAEDYAANSHSLPAPRKPPNQAHLAGHRRQTRLARPLSSTREHTGTNRTRFIS